MKVKITDLRKMLVEQAKKPPSEALATTARAAVEAARAEIDALLRHGYSPREIAELLTQSGVKISTASLSTYMRTSSKRSNDRLEDQRTIVEPQPLRPLMDEQNVAPIPEERTF